MNYQKIQIINVDKRIKNTQNLQDLEILVYQLSIEYMSKLIKSLNKTKESIQYGKEYHKLDPIAACEVILHDDLHCFAKMLAKLRDKACSFSYTEKDLPF